MSSKFHGWFMIAASWLFALSALSTQASAQSLVSVPGDVATPKLVRLATDSAAISPNQAIGITIELKANDRALQAFLADQYNPASPNFHNWLTPAQFGEKFGASPDDVNSVVDWANSHGLIVTDVYENHRFIAIRASIAQAEAAFNVTLHSYSEPAPIGSSVLSGRTVYAPDSNPTLPTDIAAKVQYIGGLSNVVQMTHGPIQVLPKAIASSTPTVPKSGSQLSPITDFSGPLGPSDLSKIYDITPVQTAAASKTPLSIGIYSPTLYSLTDVQAFEQNYGISAPTPIEEWPVANGRTTDTTAETESALDIETIMGQAPKSQIVLYEGINDGGMLQFQQIAQDDLPVISSSWAGFEQTGSANASFYTAEEATFAQMASQGQTMLNASGDSGPYNDSNNPTTPNVNYPTSSQYVLGIGGTTLPYSSNGSWAAENGWADFDSVTNDFLDGSGGGLSQLFAKPSWQSGPGVSNPQSNGKRQVPDVAALAGSPGYNIVTGGEFFPVAGTSGATPLWASSILLIDQALGKTVGFVNPEFYSILSNPAQFATAFHDITSGANPVFSCTTGWDYLTGIGSPDVGNLYSALTANLSSIPTITGFTPSSINSASPSFSLIISGTNFNAASQVKFDSVSITPVFNSVNSLTVTVPASAIASPHKAVFQVINAGAGNSAQAFFPVLDHGNTVPAPVFQPVAGSYAGSVGVTISDTLATATIKYTTDASNPATSGTAKTYTGGFTLTATTTVNAVAIQAGDTNSSQVSATYTISAPIIAPTPTIAPAAGIYAGSVNVTITDPGAVIEYTTDGSDPEVSSTAKIYTSGFKLTSSATVTAVGTVTGEQNSPLVSSAFAITGGTGSWTQTPLSPDFLDTALLLTDGGVIVHDASTYTNWFKLTPDAHGNYFDGTWSQIASNTIGRLYGETAVLRDGRVFYGGGEFTSAGQVFQDTAEVYDPVANTWTLTPSAPDSPLGDSGSSILANGTVLCSDVATDPNTDIYNPTTNSWSQASAMLGGVSGDEETWVTLSDGSILNTYVSGQRYIPTTNTWLATGAIPNALYDPSDGEIGPAAELYDGRVMVFGATGATDFFTLPATLTGAGSWTTGPTQPNSLVAPDVPSCVEQNGKVLVVLTAAYTDPGQIYEYDPVANTYAQVADPTPSGFTEYQGRMLALPNGQVLFTAGYNAAWVYTPVSGPQTAWQPTVGSVTLSSGSTYTISGTQLNGLTNGASYGDEANPYTHYPLVALADNLGNMTYAKTTNFSQMNPSAPNATQTAQFTLPSTLAKGSYNLYVIASGVKSAPFVFVNNALPVINSAAISPSTLTSSGGTITVTANVIDANTGSTISAVSAKILSDGALVTTITLTSLGGGNYSGTYVAPANATVSAITYTAQVNATDNFANAATQVTASGSTVEAAAANVLPIINSSSISPASISPGGGTITVTANITDANVGATITSATAAILKNGLFATTITLSNGGSGSTFTGTYSAPGNLSGIANTFTANVSASDNLGKSATTVVATGSTTQAVASKPSITNVTILPATFGAGGGTITVSALVTDPNSPATISSVTGQMLRNGSSVATLTFSNGGSGSTYTATYTAPGNSTGSPITFTANVSATDSLTATAGPVTTTGSSIQSQALSPVVALGSISPATIPVAGGIITLTATVTDPNAGASIDTVTGELLLNGTLATLQAMSNGGSGAVYTTTYAIGPNTSGLSQTFTGAVSAHETLNATVGLTPASGTTVQPGAVPLVMTNVTISPATLTAAGGIITVSATLTDPNIGGTINVVTGEILSNGSPIKALTLTNGGSGSVYTATYSAPANASSPSITFTATVSANDSLGANAGPTTATGSTIQAGANIIPIINSAAISPASISPGGGTITVTANITDANIGATISTATATILKNGATVTTITLSNGGSGSTFTGTYAAPGNSTAIANTFTANVNASDSLNKSAVQVAANGMTTQAVAGKPSITNVTISPATLAAGGGTITVTATVTDPNAGASISSVTGQMLKNGSVISVLTLSNGGSGSTYTTTFSAPSNTTSSPITYTANVSAADSLTATAGPVIATGSSVVAVASGLSITSALISPSTLTAGGGTITVTATVTDPNVGATISSVSGQMLRNGSVVASLVFTNGGSGSVYTATYLAASNATNAPITFTANVSALDSFNAAAGPLTATGTTVESVASAPVITAATISPGTLTSSGGLITVKATVTDPNNGATISTVTGQILRNGSVVASLTFTNGGSGSSYSATYTASANSSGSAETFTANVSATESLTASAGPITATGSTVEAAASAPVITNAVISPVSIPATGGTITLSATVTDPNNGATISTVSGQILRNGSVVANLTLSNGGSGSIYTATYSAPGNSTGSTLTFTGNISATESLSASAGPIAASGTTTQGVPSAPVITSTSISPAILAPAGGTITVSATVTDPNNGDTITSVTGQLSRNGNVVASLTLSNGGSGSNYSATFSAPANTSSGVLTYSATVSATESLNASAGPIAVTGTSVQNSTTQLPTPVIAPVGGTYVASVGVTITDTNNAVTIKYTTDGSDPATSGTAKTYVPGGFSLTSSATVIAVATESGFQNSLETSTAYTIQAATQPVISGATISPLTISAVGGTITVTATITDPNVGATISTVNASILKNGSSVITIGLSNGGSGSVYTGTYSAPSNTSGSANTFTASVTATDTVAQSAGPVAASGTTTQGSEAAPVITNAAISPVSIPAAGGTITVTATITDPNAGGSLTNIKASILENGAALTTITLSNGGSGTTYTGTYSAGANNTGSSATFTATVSATDSLTSLSSTVPASGTTTQAPVLNAPVITNAAISPLTISSTGGTITVTATVTDPNIGASINSVTASLIKNGSALQTLTLSNGGSGSVYTGTYSAPSNTSGSANTFTASVTATDTVAQSAGPVAASGTTTQAPVLNAPVITNAAISPVSIPAAGGTITVTATITDPNAGGSLTNIKASILENGAALTTITLSNGGSGTTYTGTYSAGANNTGSSATFTATVSATDSLTSLSSTVPASGTTTQAPVLNAPVITNAAISPLTISSTGGTITVTATVTDPNIGASINSVTASLIKNGSALQTLTLSNGGSGSVYTGTYSAPSNTSGSANTFTASVTATDTVAQSAGPVAASGTTTQGSEAAPVITNAAISPVSIPAAGGTITVTATITDPNAGGSLTNIKASILENGAALTTITLSNGGSGTTYTGTYSAGANNTGSSATFTATVSATDSLTSLSSTVPASGTTTQAPVLNAPVITNAAISPLTISSTGGTITVTATVTDPNIGASINSVTASLIKNGAALQTLTLSNGGSGSVYTGTYSAPSNTSGSANTFTASVTATDTDAQSAGPVAASGTTTQGSEAAPVITNAAISPVSIPAAGGTITVTATITDPNAGGSLTSIKASILENGAALTTITLSNGGSGTTYTGTYSAGANNTGSSATFTATVSATDSLTSLSSTVPASGTTTQAPVLNAPVITNAAISPLTISSTGGTITVTATVTDPNIGASINSVTASLIKNGSALQTLTLSNGGSGSVYTGTYSAPSNTSGSANTFTASVTATDTDAQSAGPVAASGTTTQGSEAAPVITNAAISPVSIPAAGGTITVTATITDPNAGGSLTNIKASILENGAALTTITLSNGGSGTTYTGTYSAGANNTGSSATFTATVSATDSLTSLSSTVPASGTTTQAPVLNAPVITNAAISPLTISSTGGTITVTATVTDPNIGASINSVTASLIKNGSALQTLTLSNGGSGSVYTGTYSAPSNTSGSANTFTASVTATDTVAQSAGPVAASGTTTQAPVLNAPVITNAAISPVSIPAAGGTITVTATITDPNAGGSLTNIKASILENGAALTTITLSNGGSGTTYTGTYSAGANNTGSSATFTATVSATDSLTSLSSTVPASGTTTQAPVLNAPVITNAAISPLTISSTGGTITVTATVTDPNIGASINSVTASLIKNGSALQTLTLSNGGSGSVYTGTYSAPSNTSGSANTFTASVTATDTVAQSAGPVAASGTTTQGSEAAPVITNAAISPVSIPAAGGTITVTATITDPNAGGSLTNIKASILENGAALTTITLSNGGSGTTYTGTYSAGANNTGSSATFTATVSATDSLTSLSSTVPASGTTTQAPVLNAPVITNAAISPLTISSTGGTITVTATVTDPNIGASINSVTASLIKNGAALQTLTLSNGGSGSVYTGTYSAPSNTSGSANTFTASVTATDTDAQSAGPVAASGTTTQGSEAAPVITNAAISPVSIPAAGGTITVTATITDPNAGGSLTNIKASILENGAALTTITLSNGGSGTTYTGTYSAGANNTGSSATFTATVSATDSLTSLSSTVPASGTTTQAPVLNAPVITNAAISPLTISSTGGTITVTATVTDPNIGASINSVTASLIKNGSALQTLTLSNGGSGSVYTGTYSAPSNTSGSANTFTASVTATDTVAQSAGPVAASGTTTQGSEAAPVITNAAISPVSIPAAGGTITVTATITDPNAGGSLTNIKASILENGAALTTITLSNGGSGTTYTGTYSAGANNTGSSATFTATVSATDSLTSLSSTVPASGTTTQAPVLNAPVITNAAISPLTISSTGGTITVTATVTDPNIGASINSVTASLIKNGAALQTLTLSNGGSGSVYTGTYSAPSNTSGSANTFTASVTATDTDAQSAGPVAASGTTTQGSEAAPVITNAAISPVSIPAAGGTITVTATITDPNAGGSLTSIKASILENGAALTTITLSNGGSGTTYTGTYSAGANNTGSSATFTATVSATDSLTSLSSTVPASGTTTQAPVLNAPVITNAAISPLTISSTGGTITVTATVTDPNIGASINSVTASLIKNGSALQTLTLSNGGSGSVYTGTYSAPSNTSGSANTFTASVTATDTVAQSAGPVAASGTTTQGSEAAPVITNAAISPVSIPAAGGTITVTATITDPNAGGSLTNIKASILENGAALTTITLSNGGSGTTYTGTYSAGANNTGSSATFTATVSATDSLTSLSSTVPASGTTTQAPVLNAPVITNAAISPLTISSTGGTITVTATVTDPNIGASINSVTASLIKNGSALQTLTLSNGGSGSVYTGTYSAPSNTSGSANTFTASVTATDTVAQSAGPVAASGTTTQGSEATVPTPTISPISGAHLGSVTVSITDSLVPSTILYTTDGSDPVNSLTAQTYNGTGFTLLNSATVRAIAEQPGYLNSLEAAADYTVTSNGPAKIRGISAINKGNGLIVVTVENMGGSTAANVIIALSKCTWGALVPTSITPNTPIAFIAPNATQTYNLQYPATSSATFLTVSGNYTGGFFNGWVTITN